MKKVKCVIVGDGAVGKAALLYKFISDYFYDQYVTTGIQQEILNINVDDEEIQLNFVKTPGQTDWERARPLCYNETDVVLACFAIDSHSSLERISEYWIEEIKKYSPSNPIILIGTKLDLRTNINENVKRLPVTYKESLKMAKKINAVKYFECSAKTNEGLDILPQEIVRVALTKQNEKTKNTKNTKNCILL